MCICARAHGPARVYSCMTPSSLCSSVNTRAHDPASVDSLLGSNVRTHGPALCCCWLKRFRFKCIYARAHGLVVVAATFGSSVSGSGAYTREPMAQRPLATTCFSYALMCSDLSSHNVHQQEKTLCRPDSHDDLKHNPILDIVVFNARCESTPRPF